MSCPNCGARLVELRCAQCGAFVPQSGGEHSGAERAVKRLAGAVAERVFAMPLASTRPQSAGHGASWWVCAAVKPTRARVVLAEGLSEAEAVRLAGAVAARLQLT
ncbi:MAG: hypothetical protein JNK82_44775 [Myxococcaceae bacterium]|nr:hypothetical protein [Myxococcaceae bacterium]